MKIADEKQRKKFEKAFAERNSLDKDISFGIRKFLEPNSYGKYYSDNSVYNYLENNSGLNIGDVLEFVSKTSYQYKSLAEALLLAVKKYNIKSRVILDTDQYLKENKNAAAYYNDINRNITIGKNYTAKEYGARAVLHEAMHAIEYEIRRYDNSFYNKMDELFSYIKKHIPEEVDEYGLTQTKEFISEAFSNPQFQALLSVIKYERKDGKIVTLLREVYDSVLKIFNLTDNSVLRHVFVAYRDQLNKPLNKRKEIEDYTLPFTRADYSSLDQKVGVENKTESSNLNKKEQSELELEFIQNPDLIGLTSVEELSKQMEKC